MKNKFNKITEKLFLAHVKKANLTLNMEEVEKNQHGVQVELDGHFDKAPITESLSKENTNLHNLAEEFANALWNYKKENPNDDLLNELSKDDLNPNKYELVHDENKNKMYLFVPFTSLYESKGKQHEAIFEDTYNNIQNAFREFIKEDLALYRVNPNTSISFFTKERGVTNNIEGYAVTFEIENVCSKNNDSLTTTVSLNIKKGQEVIFDNDARNTFEFSRYDIKKASTHDDQKITFTPYKGIASFFHSVSQSEKAFKELEEKIKRLQADVRQFMWKSIDLLMRSFKEETSSK